jgi:hypothetical protein
MSINDPTPKPNIDQRLEALTQSVELLAAMQRESEKAWTARFAEIASSITSLLRIAEIHEHRISGLEDSPQ